MTATKIGFGTIALLGLKQEGKCLYCAGQLHHNDTEVEHILAKSWGGPKRAAFNLGLTHKECNRAKGFLEGAILRHFFQTPDDRDYPEPKIRFRYAVPMALMLINPRGILSPHCKRGIQERSVAVGWQALPHVLGVISTLQDGRRHEGRIKLAAKLPAKGSSGSNSGAPGEYFSDRVCRRGEDGSSA